MSSTKIVVLGESGVGKSSLVNAICGRPNTDCASTIGASVNMAWHEYRAGSVEQRCEMIELWDIDGSSAHRGAASVFMQGAAGAILVHDLSNRKSLDNLSQWLTLVDGRSRNASSRNLLADIESCPIPVLKVGCKLDLVPNRAAQATTSSYDRMNVDCRKVIPAGSSASMALARFFDACVDRMRNPQQQVERRRRINTPF